MLYYNKSDILIYILKIYQSKILYSNILSNYLAYNFAILVIIYNLIIIN